MITKDFPLAWRWTQASHAVLPRDVLASMVPLHSEEAERFYRRGEEAFRAITVSKTQLAAKDVDVTRAWLKALPFALDGRVFVAWNRTAGLSLPWHSFIAYWDDFCYPSSDDVFVFPESGSGALHWHHDEVFEYGEKIV